MQPTIGDYRDIVIGRDRFEHWDSQRHVVFVFGVALTKDKGIVEKNDLAVYIFDYNHERLGSTIVKIRNDRKIDSQKRAGDGLYLSLKPKRRRVSINFFEISQTITTY